MTPLRKKMTEDLRLRNLSSSTVYAYLRNVACFARFSGDSPENLGSKDVRDYFLYLEGPRKLAPASRVVVHAALTFLYRTTLGRPEVMATIPRPRVRPGPASLPLTRPEVRALLNALTCSPFTYTFFATMLATGVRLSECCALSVHDIDRCARLVHVRHGKGGKARSVMLSDKLLRLLERYWRVEALHGTWLFPAQRLVAPGLIDPDNRWAKHHVASATMSIRMQKAARIAGLKRTIGSHDLRRTFGAWLLEDNRDLRLVQVLLGHASPATTARYTAVHPNTIASTRSPYDLL